MADGSCSRRSRSPVVVAAATDTVAEAHWERASPRTASIFVGVRIEGDTADPHYRHWAVTMAGLAVDMPLRTPPGASDDYNLLVVRFL